MELSSSGTRNEGDGERTRTAIGLCGCSVSYLANTCWVWKIGGKQHCQCSGLCDTHVLVFRKDSGCLFQEIWIVPIPCMSSFPLDLSPKVRICMGMNSVLSLQKFSPMREDIMLLILTNFIIWKDWHKCSLF